MTWKRLKNITVVPRENRFFSGVMGKELQGHSVRGVLTQWQDLLEQKNDSTLPQKQRGAGCKVATAQGPCWASIYVFLGSGKSRLSFKLSNVFPGPRREGLVPSRLCDHPFGSYCAFTQEKLFPSQFLTHHHHALLSQADSPGWPKGSLSWQLRCFLSIW